MEFTQLLQPLMNMANAAGASAAPPSPTPAVTVSEANGHDPAITAAPTLASISPPDEQREPEK
jgi:hypothetical protein